MDGHDADGAVRERADELYWSSDLSVNQIAEELDVSKSALYDMIRPHLSARACPDCGDELAFANRTALARGLVACTSCGWEGSEDDAGPPVEDADAERPPAAVVAGESSARTRTLVGGALLGAAAGLALVLWSRRS